ncbi:hypothetical protein RQP46_011039 [Phenoliferia psychrophenolica]
MTIVEDALPTPPVPPLSKEDLVALVGSDPKFLVKDSHAGFGYNNIRYMLESTINLASLTGRIPILPDSVWARGCAVQSEFCTEVSLRHFSDRNAPADELGANWIDNGEIWQLPIEVFSFPGGLEKNSADQGQQDFLDIPHLRVTFGPVLTLREFFVLHDLELSQIPLRGVLMSKAVALPTTEYAFPSSLLSLHNLSLSHTSADILYIQGDVHLHRKPGAVLFATADARDREMDSIAHFTLLQKALAHGREVLASRNPRSRRRLPLPTDPFYLATDESNTTSLAHYRSHGAILLADLLTPTDVAETLGPSGRFIDVLALVEQVILSKSDYFVGSGRSSTTGGVVNLRLARGAGEWSWGVVGEVV